MIPNRSRFTVLVFALLTPAALLSGCSQSEVPAAREPDRNVPFVPDTKPVPPVKWTDATVPEGTPIKLSLIDTLSSRETHRGDAFRALVTDAIIIDGSVTVPSGSNVLGVVSNVVPAATGFKGKGGMLALEFTRIDTPTGASAPLKARLAELAPGKPSAVLAGRAAPGVVTAGAAGKEAVLLSNTPITLVLEETLRIKVKQ